MLTLLVFKKGYSVKGEDGYVQHTRYFTSELDESFKMSATLTDNFKKKVEDAGVDFPLLVELDDKEKDYFFVKDRFDNKSGEIDSMYKIVLNNCRSVSTATIEQTTYEEAKKFNIDRNNE